MISRMLAMILISPKLINRERAMAARMREFSLNHWRMTECIWNVKRGTLAGVARRNVMPTAPLMMPMTNVATIAIL